MSPDSNQSSKKLTKPCPSCQYAAEQVINPTGWRLVGWYCPQCHGFDPEPVK